MLNHGIHETLHPQLETLQAIVKWLFTQVDRTKDNTSAYHEQYLRESAKVELWLQQIQELQREIQRHQENEKAQAAKIGELTGLANQRLLPIQQLQQAINLLK